MKMEHCISYHFIHNNYAVGDNSRQSCKNIGLRFHTDLMVNYHQFNGLD